MAGHAGAAIDGNKTSHSNNSCVSQGNPDSSQDEIKAVCVLIPKPLGGVLTKNDKPKGQTAMTTHHPRRSSTYRFHDSGRSDRKFLLVALTSGLILMGVLSGLSFELFPTIK